MVLRSGWLRVSVLLLLLAGLLITCHHEGVSRLAQAKQQSIWTGLWPKLQLVPSAYTEQQQQQQSLRNVQWLQQRPSRLLRRLAEMPKPDAGMPDMFKQQYTQVFPQQWKQYNDALSNVRIGSASLAELAAPLILRNVTLVNPAQLKRAVSHTGNAHRLKRVLNDLREGRRVKLAVIGGSISWGSAVERGVEDWFSLVLSHLQVAFPRANVTGRNGCVPATPSSFMNMCLQEFMDDDVDLVFLEYAVNDGWDVSNLVRRRTYERLLRKVLQKPRAPAVIQVHLPTVGMAFDAEHREKSHFHRTVEDLYGAFGAYYDLPSLSMRNAIWSLAELHNYQMNFTHFYGSNYDFIHPLQAGHRTIADMVLFGLQQAFIELLLHPWTDFDSQEVAAPLPKPMFHANWEEVNRLCRNGKAFSSVVSDAKGWQLVNEGNEFKPKFGYVSHEVGAELVLTINTTRSSQSAAVEHMNVQLAYLRSYTDMGMALIRCGGGCTCPSTLVNGHHNLRQSTIFLVRLFVTQAPSCRITVTVQAATDSGGHKFKVTGVTAAEAVAHEGAAAAHEELNQEKWLGAVLKGDGEIVERWSKAAKRRRQQQSNSNTGVATSPAATNKPSGTDDN